jgi:mxaL protein
MASARIALAVACAALVLAAWGPRPRLPVSRFDGVIVLDITQSMSAEDYTLAGRPASRLAVAKLALRHAIEAMPCGSRVGFGVFTEYRTMVLIAPLEICANFRELTSVLDAIDGRMAWAGRRRAPWTAGDRVHERWARSASDSSRASALFRR